MWRLLLAIGHALVLYWLIVTLPAVVIDQNPVLWVISLLVNGVGFACHFALWARLAWKKINKFFAIGL